MDCHSIFIFQVLISPVSCPGKVSGRGLASKQSNHYFLSKYFMSLRWEIFHVAGKYLESKFCFIFPESILKSEDAIWLSRDGRRLAFLKLNDTKVTSISYQKIDNSAEQPGSLKYAKVS